MKNVLMTVLGLGEAYYSDYSVIFLDSSTEVANTDPKCNLEAEVDFVKDAFLFQPRLLADQLPGHMDAVSKGHLKTDQHSFKFSACSRNQSTYNFGGTHECGGSCKTCDSHAPWSLSCSSGRQVPI